VVQRRAAVLDSLAGGVAHDFSNLPTTIVGTAELAAADAAPGSEPARRMERILVAAANRASELCRKRVEISGDVRAHRGSIELVPLAGASRIVLRLPAAAPR
jgi:two-component system cell cycle sensor histidine kinase/response regulator CckA